MPVYPSPKKSEKAVLDHKTLFKIKTVTDASGNAMKKIARIINGSSKEIQIEPNFKDALVEKGRLVEGFFDKKTIDAFVYHPKDFQKWKLTESDGHLVDKVGFLPFKEKVFSDLAKVGELGLIVASGETLTVKSSTKEVILAKTKKSARVTRSRSMTRSGAIRQNEIDSKSDPNMWIAGPPDFHGWFKIRHSATGKFLTSSSSDSVILEDLVNLEDTKTKPKKHLVQVKKTFVWCPDVEAYITFIADKRDYKDVDLNIEFGLDAGIFNERMSCNQICPIGLDGMQVPKNRDFVPN